MKFISFLTVTALAGVAAFTVGLALGQHVLGLFAAAASTLLVLVATNDYTPRRPLALPARTRRVRAAQALPLAA